VSLLKLLTRSGQTVDVKAIKLLVLRDQLEVPGTSHQAPEAARE
jgi:hypothetical protein